MPFIAKRVFGARGERLVARLRVLGKWSSSLTVPGLDIVFFVPFYV